MKTETNYIRFAKSFGPPLLLLAVVFLFFPGLAFMRDLQAAKDIVTFSFPYQSEYFRSLHDFSFPLWSKNANFPLFAESQGGFAHPLSLILFIAFKPNVASNLMLLIHLYAGLLFTYLFIRRLNLSIGAGLLGAIAFGLSGFLLARMGIYTIITNGAYFPILLYFTLLYSQTRRLKYLIFFVIAGALAVLAGQFQITFYGLLFSGIYLIYLERKRLYSALPLLIVMAIFVVALSAVQVLPTIELLLKSARTTDTAGDYSLFPPQILQLLLPDLFGRAAHPAFLDIGAPQVDDYWGRSSFIESAFYVGILPLLLAVFAIGRGKRIFWIVIFGITVLFSFGTYTPLFKLYELIPIIAHFRAPARLMFVATMALSVLAAQGFDLLFAEKRKRTIYISAVTLLVAIVTLLAVHYGVPFAKSTLYAKAEERAAMYEETGEYDDAKEYFVSRADMFIERAVETSNPLRVENLVIIGLILLIGGAFFITYKYKVNPAIMAVVLLVIAVADLYYYARDLNPTVAHERIDEPPPTAEYILSKESGRTFSTGYDMDGDNSVGMGLVHENSHLNWDLDLLIPRTSLRDEPSHYFFSAIEDSFTYPAQPGGYRKMRIIPQTLAPLSAFNVRYYVRRTPLIYPTVSFGSSDDGYIVYKNKYTMPRVYIVGNVTTIEDTEETVDYMFSGAFDPREELIAEKQVDSDKRATPFNTSAEILEYESDYVMVRTYTRYPAMLFFGDLFFEGWEATVDGRPIEIIRANAIGRGVEIPPGNHKVEFRYKPQSFTLGLKITGIAILLVLLLIILERIMYKVIYEKKLRNNDSADTTG